VQADARVPVDRKRPHVEMAPMGAGLLGNKKKKAGKAAKNASSLINKWQAVRKVLWPRVWTLDPRDSDILPSPHL